MGGDPMPVQKATREETFKCLVQDFALDEKVLKKLIESPIQNLEEFRFYFVQESEIATWLADIDLGKEQRIMEARARRAWHSVKQMATLREADRTRSDTADLDDMLDEVSLRDVKTEFWKRYKLRFPADITPSDSMVSRCHREMGRRMLMVFNVWQARSLMHQVTSSQKKRKIAESLFVVDAVEEETPQRTVDQYLDRMYTYLLALAIAGAQKAPGCPQATEALGAESTSYVMVPLDLMQSYYWRARRASQCVPEHARLGWLEKLDTEERGLWVSSFRDSNSTLGVVVSQVMQKRDAHWAFTSIPMPRGEPPRTDRRNDRNDRRSGGATKPPPPPPAPMAQQKLAPGTIATRLRDGTAICHLFQTGKCSKMRDRQCQHGVHKCGKVNKKNRVCGMPNHGADQCRMK